MKIQIASFSLPCDFLSLPSMYVLAFPCKPTKKPLQSQAIGGSAKVFRNHCLDQDFQDSCEVYSSVLSCSQGAGLEQESDRGI